MSFWVEASQCKFVIVCLYMYCRWVSNYQEWSVGIPITGLYSPRFCAWSRISNVICRDLFYAQWVDVIVRLVDIGWIVNHQSLLDVVFIIVCLFVRYCLAIVLSAPWFTSSDITFGLFNLSPNKTVRTYHIFPLEYKDYEGQNRGNPVFFLYNIQRYQMHTWKNYNDASGIKPTVNNNGSNVISFYSSFDYDPHLWLTTGFIGKSNMTGASSETGIVYRSWAYEFIPCCSICIFMCHCLYLFFFFWRFYVFSFYDLGLITTSSNC